jgi:hypothetical protein
LLQASVAKVAGKQKNLVKPQQILVKIIQKQADNCQALSNNCKNPAKNRLARHSY